MVIFNILLMLYVAVLVLPNTIGILILSSSPTEKLRNQKILKIIWLIIIVAFALPNIIYYFKNI